MRQEACSGCGTRFAVGFLACPRCGTAAPLYARHAEGAQVPRITVAEGPSNPAALPGETGYVDPGHAAEPADENTPAAVDYTSMSQAALRDEAKTRGLPAGGSKADLAARLNDHDQQAATAAGDTAAPAANESGATA